MPMDAYLLDTSIASRAFDVGSPSHQQVRERLAGLGDASISICAVSVGEVEYGLHVSPAIDSSRHAIVRRNLARYQILDIDRHTASVFGSIRGALFRRHGTRDARGRLREKRLEDLLDTTTSRDLGIQENDLWIVSVGVQYNLRFITCDRMERILAAARDLHSYDRAWIWPL
jgi:tRNA(fMet)-specific endonuclease VapC